MRNVRAGALALPFVVALEPTALAQAEDPPASVEAPSAKAQEPPEGAPTLPSATAELPAARAQPAEAAGPREVTTPAPETAETLGPALPEGMTLDEVLERAAQPPPEHFPDAIDDDSILAFLLADQFEYRVDGKSEPDALGWEADAWIGGDFNRLWMKPEGEATFHSPGSIGSEFDALRPSLASLGPHTTAR